MFGCYNYYYFDLESNISNTSDTANTANTANIGNIDTFRTNISGLNIYNNQWYDVYNFTPGEYSTGGGGGGGGSGSNYIPLSEIDESMIYNDTIFDIGIGNNNNNNSGNEVDGGSNDNTNSSGGHKTKSNTQRNNNKNKNKNKNWSYKLLAFGYNEYNDILLHLYGYNSKIQVTLEEQLQIVNPIGNKVIPVIPVTCGMCVFIGDCMCVCIGDCMCVCL